MSVKSYNTNRSVIRGLFTFLVIALILVMALAFAGCSTAKPLDTPDPAASSATTPDEPDDAEAVETEEAPVNPVFGGTITYDDGISISVSAPAEYVPTEYAAGTVEGMANVKFEFVITNNSNENFDPTLVYATTSSAGVEGQGIFDTSESIGFPPQTTVIPGATIKWNQAFAVTNPADIIMDVSVGFTNPPAIFVSAK